mmetsp:Transcript_19846/g.43102  ORF Transcript_19846/g.43102 Transcript_19846/m.43102 type:complete len:404 (+) Transcript_19846:382-1593(+)
MSSYFTSGFLQAPQAISFLELNGPLPPAPSGPPVSADPAGCLLAIALNVATALMTVCGFVLQKKASIHRARWVIGDMAISGRWLLGLFIGVIIPIPAQVIAYGLAPMALLTPLSGVSVALNMVVAPKLLGEELQTWPDVPASLAILAGTFLTTVAGPRHEKHLSFAELFALLGGHIFVFSTIGLAILVAFCIGYMHCRRQQIEDIAKARAENPNMGHVILPGVVAASFGCLTNICLKAVGELMKGDASFFQAFLWLIGAAVFAIVQLNFVNRGLRLYMQTIFFPVYNALLVLTNTMHGAIFYKEYQGMMHEAFRSFIFLSGMGCILAGIGLFRLRKQNPEIAGAAAAAAALPSSSPAHFEAEWCATGPFVLVPASCHKPAAKDDDSPGPGPDCQGCLGATSGC